MGRVHYALLVVLVLYFPLRVKPGPVKDGDVSSDVTTEKADPFKAADMINLYRCSALLRILEFEKLFSLVFYFTCLISCRIYYFFYLVPVQTFPKNLTLNRVSPTTKQRPYVNGLAKFI